MVNNSRSRNGTNPNINQTLSESEGVLQALDSVPHLMTKIDQLKCGILEKKKEITTTDSDSDLGNHPNKHDENRLRLDRHKDDSETRGPTFTPPTSPNRRFIARNKMESISRDKSKNILTHYPDKNHMPVKRKERWGQRAGIKMKPLDKVSSKIRGKEGILQRVLEQHDIGKVGIIEEHELLQSLEDMDVRLTQRESKQLLKTVGCKDLKSGLVDINEFMQKIQPKPSPSKSNNIQPDEFEVRVAKDRLSRKIKGNTSRLRAILHSSDRDKDGKLTYSEFKRAITRLGIQLSDNELQSVLSRFDTSENGLIDLDMFSSSFNDSLPGQKEQHARHFRAKLLNRLDTDVIEKICQYSSDITGTIDVHLLREGCSKAGVYLNDNDFQVLKEEYNHIRDQNSGRSVKYDQLMDRLTAKRENDFQQDMSDRMSAQKDSILHFQASNVCLEPMPVPKMLLDEREKKRRVIGHNLIKEILPHRRKLERILNEYKVIPKEGLHKCLEEVGVKISRQDFHRVLSMTSTSVNDREIETSKFTSLLREHDKQSTRTSIELRPASPRRYSGKKCFPYSATECAGSGDFIRNSYVDPPSLGKKCYPVPASTTTCRLNLRGNENKRDYIRPEVVRTSGPQNRVVHESKQDLRPYRILRLSSRPPLPPPF